MSLIHFDYVPSVLYFQKCKLTAFVDFNADPNAKESFCRYCLRELPISQFLWSRKRQRWTLLCTPCGRLDDGKYSGQTDGKDFYRPVPVLQKAYDHNLQKLQDVRHYLQSPSLNETKTTSQGEALRHLCERYILLSERLRLISEKIDEIEFLQAAVEAEQAEKAGNKTL